jgi:ribonuclease R
VAAFLSDRIGATFTGRITGVTRFGLFVRLAETGADGLVPVSSLGGEYFIHDDHAHALIGERSGRQWRLGRMVEVELKEATPLTGGLLFGMLSEAETPPPGSPPPRLGARRQAASRVPPRGGPPRNPPKGVRRGQRR